MWRTELAKTNEKAAESIASPVEYENLFPELSQTLQAEKVRMHTKAFTCTVPYLIWLIADACVWETSSTTSFFISTD